MLSPIEVMILHGVRNRDRPKRQAEMLLAVSIEAALIATCAIREPPASGLVEISHAGNENLVGVTAKGAALCERYATLRETLLASAVREGGPAAADLSTSAALLRTLSGFYEQATRAAATL